MQVFWVTLITLGPDSLCEGERIQHSFDSFAQRFLDWANWPSAIWWVLNHLLTEEKCVVHFLCVMYFVIESIWWLMPVRRNNYGNFDPLNNAIMNICEKKLLIQRKLIKTPNIHGNK
jgi:hypothetical protein